MEREGGERDRERTNKERGARKWPASPSASLELACGIEGESGAMERAAPTAAAAARQARRPKGG